MCAVPSESTVQVLVCGTDVGWFSCAIVAHNKMKRPEVICVMVIAVRWCLVIRMSSSKVSYGELNLQKLHLLYDHPDAR